MDPRQLLIALNAADRINRAALCRLAADLDAWIGEHPRGAPAVAGLAHSLGVPAAELRRALALRPRAAELAERESRRAERIGYRLLTRRDAEYPRPLLDHGLPPPVLTCRGLLPRRPGVAIVGSRRMSAYGARVAALFSRELAAAGLAVVSGFARGVDQTAHRAALEAPGGCTVAVLGCGVDVEYPRGSAALSAAIGERGAVVSEFPLGAEPRPWRFPIRNRVIAALAVGTLIVQAAIKSGSLITAHLALELGRDVYAVPGDIFDPLAAGTNALIADGALMARKPRDVLESLSIGVQQELFPAEAEPAAASPATEPAAAAPAPGVPRDPLPRGPLPTGIAGRLLDVVPAGDGATAEELAAQADLGVDQVLGALLELELGGWVNRLPGPVFTR